MSALQDGIRGARAPSCFRIGLRAQLVALVLAATLPMLGFGVAAVWQLGGSYRAAEENGLRDTARALAHAVDRDLEAGIAALNALAASPLIDRGDLVAFHEQARAVGHAFGGWVVLTTPDLRQLVNTQRPPGTPLPATLASYAAAERAIAGGRAVVSDLVTGALAQRPIAPIVMPVRRDGRTVALLVLSYDLDRLTRPLISQSTSETTFVTLIDGMGTIVARTRRHEETIGRSVSPEFFALLKGRQEHLAFAHSPIEETEVVTATAPLQLADWTLAVSMPRETYDATWRAPLWRLALTGSALLLLAAVAALALGRSLTRPLGRLVRRAEAVAAGTPPTQESAPPLHTAELATLRRALLRAEEALKRRALAEGRAAAAEEAAARLRESEARFRALAESIPQLAWITLPDGRVEFLNARWWEFTGAEWRTPIETLWREAVHPEDVPHGVETWRRALSTGEPVEMELRLRRADGAWRWFLARSLPLRAEPDAANPQGRILRWFGTCTDITELVEAREARAREGAELERQVAERTAQLAESEARFRAIFDAQFQFIGLLDPQGTLLAINRTALEFLDAREEEVVGRPIWDIPGWQSDETSRARLQEEVARAATGAFVRYEMELPGEGGRRTVLDFSLKAVRAPGTGEMRWLIAEGRDVTERRDLQRRLVQAEKMEALGQLAGGVAHDFNNVLQAVSGGARLILRRPEDPAAVRRLADLVVQAADRGAAVARRLLAFSRHGELRATAVDPAELLAGLREVLAHTLGPAVEVRVQVPQGLPALEADRAQLETALVNLAVNARDAMPRGGVLTLSAVAEEVASGDAHPAALEPGTYIRLAVRDTGIGMDAATLARAAEPFFTTKEQGKGTGLGLAMAKGLAEQSGGGMSIESRQGEGTTVTLWFPRSPEPARELVQGEPPAARPPAAAITYGPSHILLVDDEATVRAVLADGLAARGFRVRQAESGREALELLDAGVTPDLLVTDLAMPQMDGVTLLREVRRRRPGIPAIVVTGYAGDAALAAVRGAVGHGPMTLLRKPVQPEDLADSVAALLAPALEAMETAPTSEVVPGD